jgi:hypothetical protein
MSVVTSPRRVVSNAARIDQRLRYGDIASMRQAARRELAAGNPTNAFVCLQGALSHALRLMWLAQPGHENSSITNAEALVKKLRSAMKIDSWTYDVLMLTFRRSKKPVSSQSVHLLDFIVETMVSDLASTSDSVARGWKRGVPC